MDRNETATKNRHLDHTLERELRELQANPRARPRPGSELWRLWQNSRALVGLTRFEQHCETVIYAHRPRKAWAVPNTKESRHHDLLHARAVAVFENRVARLRRMGGLQ